MEDKQLDKIQYVDLSVDIHHIFLVPAAALRADDFERYFDARRESRCQLVEKALGKRVQRDVSEGLNHENSSQFDDRDLDEALADLG